MNLGKCGVCGDLYDVLFCYNEVGGKFVNGIVFCYYSINDIFINVIVEVKKNMRGYFEFCLCFEVLELVLVMYVCLDKYYLEIEGYGK